MAIAITEEHQEFARVARAFLSDKNVIAQSRALLDAPEETLPAFWKELIKNNANEQIITTKINELQEKNKEIRETYSTLINKFYQSSEILNPITIDYYRMVLNID